VHCARKWLSMPEIGKSIALQQLSVRLTML